MQALDASRPAVLEMRRERPAGFRGAAPRGPGEPVRPRRHRWYPRVKAAADFLLAVPLTLLALPVIALAALAVRLTSRGPAFYTQARVGRHGRTFTIYKLRTML